MRQLLIGLSIAAAIFAFDGASAQSEPSAKPKLQAPSLDQAMADYRRKLKDYEAARAKFEAVAEPYWTQVEEPLVTGQMSFGAVMSEQAVVTIEATRAMAIKRRRRIIGVFS